MKIVYIIDEMAVKIRINPIGKGCFILINVVLNIKIIILISQLN